MVLAIIVAVFAVVSAGLVSVAWVFEAPVIATSVVVVLMGAVGIALGFCTAAHAAYLSRQKRQYDVDLPGEAKFHLSNPLMKAQFNGMLVGMSMAITERVAFRVLKEASPVHIPEEFEESAQAKAREIMEEEVSTFMEELQRNVDGRDY